MPSQTSGSSGLPVIETRESGLNTLWTTGPYLKASINGIGYGSSVDLGVGAAFQSSADLALPLNGIDWSHVRMYSSNYSPPSNWQGEGWWASEMAYMTVSGGDPGDATIYMDPDFSMSFTYDSELDQYNKPSDAYPFKLTFISGSEEYQLLRVDGMLWVFHDAGATNAGKLKRIEDAYGNDLAFTYSSGKLTEIVADVVDGSDHKFTYTYFTGGDNNGKLQYIKAYKTTTITGANLIGQIEYVYHDSSTDTYGITGDLMKVIVTQKATTDGDGTLSIENTYRYRYYKGAWSSPSNKGTDHQLRYVLNSENAQRLNDAVGAPDSQSNTDWETYSNVYYEYESGSGRVTKTEERLPGSGCGCGGGGGAGTTTYAWTINGGSPGLNTYKTHCVADREDNSRVIFDINRRSQILTWVLQDENDGSPTREQIWHFDYGTSGPSNNRLATIYYPSVCSDYDEATYAVTTRSGAGLIYEMDYDYSTNTYDGYPERIRVKQGTSGAAQTLIAYGRTVSARPDLPTTIIHYESTGETNGRTSTLTYTFYDGNKYQPKELDISYPTVSTGKNGPNTAAVEKRFFDKRTGAPRWTLDGEGYVKYYAYDSETGVQNFMVIDANTSSLLADIDSTWDGVAHGGLGADDTVPFTRSGSGSALNIHFSSTIDWLGRTRKSTDAGGMITYSVYKDDETRSYPAWNTSTYVTLLPIQVAMTDKDGRVEESLTLKTSVTPSKDGSNEPTGTESYGNSDMASRTVTTYNISGSVSNAKRYHTMAVSGDGTRYTNYYQTDTEYDSMGRVEYTIEDVADESTYDREQVTKHYYDFLGRQIKTAQGVSTNSHDIGGGKPTLVTTTEFFFDDPDTDATPEQGDGDGNLSWVKNWYGTGGSDHNETNYRYDWRNRKCLTIPPLGPYTLVSYDHLDRVTTIGKYSSTTNLDPGDDPATTEYANRVELSNTYFDERGRVYKTETFDDPSDSTPADALVSNTYYDRRGLVWASDPANTGISFTSHDGAGRRILTFQGTQFDSAKYTSDAPDYPDDNEGIVQLSDFTLDDVGNATKTITKELNHDDTNGMNLSSSDYIRTYVYSYYDAAHRLTDTVNYGTNNSNGWKDYSTPPTYDNDGGTAGDQPAARSDTALVTTYAYNSDGRQEKITTPKNVATLSVFDKLGRVTQKEEDDGGGTERITAYQYNAQGSLTKIIADLSTDQVTEHVYGDAQNSRWVTKIKYPATDTSNSKTLGQPSTETYDQIVFTYNADGTLATQTDQNGTVLTWSHDTLRRKTEEEVTTLGSYTEGAGAPDGAIRSFTWTYNNEGRAEYVTSHTDTTPDTSTWTDAANQVKYTYNAAGKLTKEEQEEDGKVDGSTLAVQYGYGTDYSSAYYDRQNYIQYPDGRKIWFGYTNSGGASTFQDTINDTFNRVGQIAKDNSSSIGNLLAEYEFNGMHRQIRRVHDEDTGKYGNDTRLDLWHGTTGQYDGLDRFGRIVDMRQVDFNGGATNFLQRKYTYDRNGNRLSIEDPLYMAESQSFSYDNLNRLNDSHRGILNASNAVYVSDVSESFNMDLLGNFTPGAGGLKINATTSTITHAVNETNEITTLDRPNPAGAPIMVKEPFTSTLSSFWSANKGTWSIISNKVNVDTLTSSEAVLLASPKLDIVTYEVAVTFPTSSSTNKAGFAFAHDGTNSYYAVVLNRNTNKIALYKITSGSWGSVLTSANVTINDSTAYTIKAVVKQQGITVSLPAQSAVCTYDPGTDFGVGQAGLYSDKTNVTFDDFKVYNGTAADPQVPGISGSGGASLASGQLQMQASGTSGSEVAVQNFLDDDYMLQTYIDVNYDGGGELWVRYRDPNNGYKLSCNITGTMTLYKVVKGNRTSLATGLFNITGTTTLKVKVNGTSIKVWDGGTLRINTTDGSFVYGGVAFGGNGTKFDDSKIGYDNNADDDIDDPGDDIVWSADYASTSKSPAYDHAGNLIDDGKYIYVYDAWNRLVKVRAKEDDVTIQTAEFDGLGRRIKKVVTNSGENDKTEVYLYDGQKIIETRNGSGTMVQQFIHGTQYIDELVMIRVKDKGDLYVHQDANWNVIGMTDLGRHLVERDVYSPYGELTVHQSTGYGDRDGDGKVDSTDKGTVGATCTGTVTGSCRIMDLDFDGDYDSNDATKFDALPSGLQRTPGRFASTIQQPFAHQGLLFEPEIESYQNRARQYDLGNSRFLQIDPLAHKSKTRGLFINLHNKYEYLNSNTLRYFDPKGLLSCPDSRVPGSAADINQVTAYCNGFAFGGSVYTVICDTLNAPLWGPTNQSYWLGCGAAGLSGCCYQPWLGDAPGVIVGQGPGDCKKWSCIAPNRGDCVTQATIAHEAARRAQTTCVPGGCNSNLPCKPQYTNLPYERDCDAWTANYNTLIGCAPVGPPAPFVLWTQCMMSCTCGGLTATDCIDLPPGIGCGPSPPDGI